MAHWRRLVSVLGGRRIIGALGVLYVVFSVFRMGIGFNIGAPTGSIFIITVLIAVPGFVLIYEAYWLSQSDINTEFHTDIAGWCLAGFGTMAGLLILFHLQPEGGISEPLTGIPILTALGSVGGLGVGIYDGRAKTQTRQLKRRANQQDAVADLGQLALETDDLDDLMYEAVRKVADALDNDYCKVLDLDPENEELLLRQGVGWKDGIAGEATVSSVEADSQAAYTLATSHPIVVEDLETETRFSGPDLLRSHDVHSGISTIIGPFDEPWGILGTHDTDRQEFTEEDVNFVQSVANILAEAIERTETEQQLRERQAQLDVATEAASIGIWTWDIRENVVTGDEYLAELYGTDSVIITEGAPIEVFYDQIHEDETEETKNEIERAVTDTGKLKTEYRLKDDDITWVEVRGEVEYDGSGDPIRMHGTVADITDRKEREQRLERLVAELEESNERLEQFAYAASHDLQEPLRMVSSYLQLIDSRYELDEEGEEFLEFAVDGAERMRSMIDGLLQYSRVETQGDPLEPVDLECILDDVRDNLQMTITENDATIEADSLPRVQGDPDQLRQVFQNLLDNAIEYSDDRPTVHVTAERNGSDWIISVEDEGTGIDPQEQEQIFEVFQRGHSHSDGSGTGIGLALCERIIERHGSEIWVESEPDEGATFSFALPASGSQ
ncbi:GAF domain-containing protein [Natronorubrum sp. JWXQ-INN-674]|uniref:histidine kinase n=1 Tax=Natronorubrum halalkaliphilum TaxID=2691917 RepID=A0A6B0VK30_9EURY|nr:ATP-binding protein [Natronorubrum halalkaliphilum]MXV61904.1 GAF domain-containing protein [Natronorubrum halalkaliphilum]